MSSAADLTAAGWISYQSHSGSLLAIETTASNVHSGSKALDIDSWEAGSSSDYVIVGLPLMDVPINTLQIGFSYKVSTGNVSVGYLTDADDASTFVSVQTFNSSSSYTTIEDVNLSSVPATAARIAIKYLNWYRCYVDDINVFEIPNCIKPTALEATLTPGDGSVASLSWTAGGTETDWVLEYGTASDFNGATSVNVSGTPSKDLTGLTAETTYYARVKADCGDEQSDWSAAIEFTPTNAISVTLNDGTATNGYVPVYGYYVDNSSKSQFIIPAEDLADLTWGKISKLTFYSSNASISWGAAEFDVCLKEVSSTSLSALEDWSSMSTVYHGSLAISGNQMVVSFDNNFTYMGGNLMIGVNQTVKGTYSSCTWLGVASTGSSMGGYGSSISQQNFLPKVTIDYIPGEAPDCLPVSGLSVSEIEAHSASLDWTEGGSESAWKLYYKKASDEDFSDPINVESKPYLLDNLDEATAYQFKVVAVCGDSESDPSGVASFTTECEALTIDAYHPYSENFDSYAMESAYTPSAQTLPICWSSINTTTYSSYQVYPTIYYYSYTDYSHSSPNSLRFYSSYSSYSSYDPQDQYAILPVMNDISGLRIKLYARTSSSSSNGTFYVGVMSDPADASTFEPISDALAPASDVYELFTIPFSDYAGGGQYIAIKMEAANSTNTSRYLYIDDIVVEPIPDCLEPAGLAVAEGDDAISTNSVLLQISEGESGASAWKLQYKKSADEEWITLSDAVQDNPYLLEGLDASTNYDIRIAAWCDPSNAEAVSGYLDPISVATACEDIISFPWGEDFNSLTAGIPVCWDNEEGTTTNDSYKWNYYASGRDGAGLRFNSYNNSNGLTNFLKTPVLSLPSDKAMLLTFMYKNPTGGDFSVLVSTDGGASYAETPLASGLTSQSSWTEKECDLSAYAGQNVVIVFKGTSNYGSGDAYIYLDDVKVDEAPTCAKPSGLSYTYSSRTAHSVELYWTNGAEGQIAWNIAYSTVSTFSPEDGEETTHIVPADANPFVLTGLDQSTTYYAYVRANCGGEDGVSAWSTAKATFSTISGHQMLNSLALVDGSLGSASAKVNWKSNAANERHSSYEVYISQQNTLPATEEELSSDGLILNIEDTFYVFNNLEPETQYYVWVRDNCGEDGLSDWSSRATFTTTANCPVPAELSVSNVAAHTADIAWNIGEADSYSVQYRVAEGMDGIEEGFEGVSLPSGWTTEGNGTWSVGTGDYSSSTGAHSGSKNAKINHGTSGDETYLVTPSMNLEGKDGCRINLWYVNRAWVSDIDGFGIYYRISGGEWVEIFSTAVAHSDWTQFEGEVPVGALEANCQFGFKFTDGYGYGVSIDDIQIGTIIPAGEWQEVAAESGERLAHLSGLEPETKYEVQVKASCGEEYSDPIFFTTIPSCLPISALTLANVDAHAASFTWTASASAETQWQYACVAAGATPESWSLVSATAAVEVSGLSSNTSYDFYVRAYCGADDQGEAIKLNFRTDCEAIIIDADHSFSEGFEEVTFVPNCWSSVASESHNWSRTTSNVHSGSGSAHSGYYGDIYLILPDLQIEEDAYLSFWSYNNFVSDYTEAKGARNSVVLLAGESEVELWAAESVSQSQVRTIINLSAYKGQTVSLAFKYEGDNAHDWYIDDVLVSANPSLEITEAGYATYFNADNAYIMPNGVVGHVFSVADGLQEAYESGDIVPANVPLVLQGAQGEYSLIPTVGGESISLANDLIGVNNEMTIVNHADTLYYVLSLNAANEVESVGFYWMNETGAGGFSMPAHKAYLTVYSPGAGAEAEAAPRFYLFHGENNATWLNNLQGVDGTVKFFHNGHFYIMRDHVIYDATGKRVELKYN